MAKITIIIDVPNTDPALVDPHEIVDSILDPVLGTFTPGGLIKDTVGPEHRLYDATFESAEWDS